MKRLLFILLSIIMLVSCESKFDKKMRRAVEYANSKLPNQANDWMWKDSVSYNPKEKTVYHYFSYRVEEPSKTLIRKMIMNDQLLKNLLLTEDITIYLDNNVSMGVVSTFGDGEVISKIIVSPEEMKKVSAQGISYKDLTEYIYANMAISISAVCPYRIDECTTITRADFIVDKMELVLYWDIDDECLPLLNEQDIREVMRAYIVELVRYNHRNILELERFTTLSPYKRSVFPVKVTLVCSNSNGFCISESVISTDVAIN